MRVHPWNEWEGNREEELEWKAGILVPAPLVALDNFLGVSTCQTGLLTLPTPNPATCLRDRRENSAGCDEHRISSAQRVSAPKEQSIVFVRK